jgi:phosphate transport system substrate-binding protein
LTLGVVALFVAAGSACSSGDRANTLNGSGATFPKPFYEQAIADFADKTPEVTVNYAGGGSGKGKKDLADQLVSWAGTDSLVKDEDKATFRGGEFLYFPTVAAPITVSYNLEGVDELKLSPETLAKIFQGDITTWNDPAIAADNTGLSMPSNKIVVTHRSDGSGTTSNFTKYLDSAAKGTWTLGAGDTVDWPRDSQAGNGNSGVAQIVKSTKGAIGYVDVSDAKATGLTFASIKNATGNFVAPTLEGATAALDAAEVNDNLTYSALDTDGENAYPITASTYVLVYVRQTDPEVAEALKGWLTFLLTDAQATANDVDFAPLPEGLSQKALAQINKITVG